MKKFLGDTYNEYLQNKDYDMILTGVYNSFSPDLTTFFGEGNYSNYNNDTVNKLIANIENLSNEDELKRAYKEIYTQVMEDMPIISLYRNKNITLTNQSLTGDVKPNNYTTFYNIQNWIRR